MNSHMNPKFAVAILAALAFASPAAAMTEADCKAEFANADVNKDGVLSEAEMARYAAAMRVGGKAMPADGRMTEAAFIESCKADVFAARKMDAGAPLKGANSFTENQAKDRAMAAGFTNVSALTKDADGIWRGTASMNGKEGKIAVDFKGNVVAN